MSKPRATVVKERPWGNTGGILRVDSAEGFWIVVYDGKPINLVKSLSYFDAPKYVRNGWSAPGHALAFARKMNHWFNTDLFTVKQVI